MGYVQYLHHNNPVSKKMFIEKYYPNDDVYRGKCSLNLIKMGNGTYHWGEGFTYEGEFFANTPYGKGVYKDCLGVEREGYFFRGFLLEKDFGLEKLKKCLETKYFKNGIMSLASEDLKLLTDSDIYRGSQIFKDCPIQFRDIYNNIEKTRKIFLEDLNNIKDGELNYDYNWNDNSSYMIASLILNSKFGKDDKQGKDQLEKRAQKVSKIKIVNNKTKKTTTISEFTTLESNNRKAAKSEEGKGLYRSPHKERSTSIFGATLDLVQEDRDRKKYAWIRKIKIKKPHKFEIEQIMEMINDQDYLGMETLYKRYIESPRKTDIVKLFMAEDSKSRNVLLNCAFYGRRQFMIDFLTALIRSVRSNIVTKEELIDLLKHRDYEGNNVIDLLCIKGFDEEDEEMVANIEKEKEPWLENLFMPEEKRRLQKEIFKSPSKLGSNFVFNDIIKMMKNKSRRLFQSAFLTYERLGKYTETVKNDAISCKTLFLSKRSICLFAIFELLNKLGSLDLVPKEFYINRRNNPLHFTLFHADLHATMQLLRYNNDMLLWRNGMDEAPPQVIRWSGENFFKSKAVFGSILREFTRNINLKIIKELLLSQNKILKPHKEKSIHNFEAEDKDEARRVEKMKSMLNKNCQFDYNNVYLYTNNYVLLSPELCKQYVDFIKEKSRFRMNKKDHRIQKKFTFASNSELESLQKNFLDYYQGTFIGYHPQEIQEYFRNTVQEILTWYVFIYGDAEINPQIYDLLKIDPFEIKFEGRNIFHFMCENNSGGLLKNFLDFLYEKCHTRPFDPSRDDYEEWDKAIDPKKLKELKEKLSIQTAQNRETPAHLCAIHQSFDCLELLVQYNVSLEATNLRGRTVRELLTKNFKEEFIRDDQFSPNDISDQFLMVIKSDMLSTCKQHSLKYRHMEGIKNRQEGLEKVINNSIFSLNKKLTEVRQVLLEDSERFFEEKSSHLDDFEACFIFMKYTILLRNYWNRDKRQKFRNFCLEKLKDLKNMESEFKDKNELENLKVDLGEMIPGTELNHKTAITLIRSFIYSFNDDKLIQLSTQNYIRLLFDLRTLESIEKFKYKKMEKLVKKDLLRKLQNSNLAQPLTPDIKNCLFLDRLFCIQVTSAPNNPIQDHPVLVQLNRIVKKYSVYSGGLKIDLIKGYPVKTQKPIKWYKPSTYLNFYRDMVDEVEWFILIKVSDELLNKVAVDDQMKTYNMKHGYHTLFMKDPVRPEELEPLRDSQRVLILMKLLNEEFNLDSYKENKLIKSYFPVHNYPKRKALEELWQKHKYHIHFLENFTSKYRDSTLQFISLMSFYLGTQQGYFFGFFCNYTHYLFSLFAFGAIGSFLQYIQKVDRDIVVFSTAIIVGAWSAVFINSWKLRERELAFSFDSHDDESIKQIRIEYRGTYEVDPGTLKIQKKKKVKTFRRYMFTILVWFIGFLLTNGIYTLVIQVEGTDAFGDRNIAIFVSGMINGVLNFVVSEIFKIVIRYAVLWENHFYKSDMRTSNILKSQNFKLFSTFYALVYQSIITLEQDEFDDFSLKVLSNLLTYSTLNYGLSVGVPLMTYMISRFHFISYILLCKWCCCRKLKGKLDEFREEAIIKILADKMSRNSFLRYCTDEGKMSSKMRDKIEDYIEKKIKEEEEAIEKSIRDFQKTSSDDLLDIAEEFEFQMSSRTRKLELKMLKGDEYNIPGVSLGQEEIKNHLKAIEKIEKDKEYKGKATILGENRFNNISLRLKEEFAKYVLGREQVIESSYMIDLDLSEADLYSSLLIQFTFICFFSQFLVVSGFLSYLINLLIVVLTVKIFTKVSRRSISRNDSNIEIWNRFFDTISYLGIVFNAIFAVKFTNGLTSFTGQTLEESDQILDTELIYRVQFFVLVLKFVVSFLIPALPAWIEQRISREKLMVVRNRKKLTNNLSKFKKKFDNFEELFEDQDTADLKYFFKNEDKICEFLPTKKVIEDESKVKRYIKLPRNNLFRMTKDSTHLL